MVEFFIDAELFKHRDGCENFHPFVGTIFHATDSWKSVQLAEIGVFKEVGQKYGFSEKELDLEREDS